MSAHSTHCCKHGCKYGDPECPVEFGTEPGILCDCEKETKMIEFTDEEKAQYNKYFNFLLNYFLVNNDFISQLYDLLMKYTDLAYESPVAKDIKVKEMMEFFKSKGMVKIQGEDDDVH